MKTAKLVKKLTEWTGEAALYELSEPLDGHKLVIVSATVAMFSGPETYIFAATDKGEVEDYGELEGSYRGGLNHETALEGAGYSVVPNDKVERRAPSTFAPTPGSARKET